jgi:hypothetical protein
MKKPGRKERIDKTPLNLEITHEAKKKLILYSKKSGLPMWAIVDFAIKEYIYKMSENAK